MSVASTLAVTRGATEKATLSRSTQAVAPDEPARAAQQGITRPDTPIRWTESRTRQLIELREKTRLTQREIAERLGVTKGQLDKQVALLLHAGRLTPRSGTVPCDRNGSPRSWATVRSELTELYIAGEDHRAMAHQLNLTRIQLHTQLTRLFRNGLPKR